MEDDLALVGEFDGVAEQVEQDLFQTQGVADQCPGNIRVGIDHQFNTFCRTLA